MKKLLIAGCLVAGLALEGKSQQIDSLFFNLYTDSLKKGTHNYISVDGKTSSGKWIPLTEKDIVLSSSAFRFSGNDLIVTEQCAEDKVIVKAVLKSTPNKFIERTIWIKQLPDPELPDEPGTRSKIPARRGRRS